MNKKIYISAYPFCETSLQPINLLKKNKILYTINKKKRKHTEKEIFKILSNYDGLIADTEPLTNSVLQNTNKLKIISRVGIGLNSVDLDAAKRKKIAVAFTPDAPTMAVVDLTIGLILCCLRNIIKHHVNMKKKIWSRYAGYRLQYKKIGIIGLGRIGTKVSKMLIKMGAKKVFYNDLIKKNISKKIIYKSKKFIYKNCDIISFHVPLTKLTNSLFSERDFKIIKKNCIIINTARGEIINEKSLFKYLKKNQDAIAAIDVYDDEPYKGELTKLENCILTPHIGSMSIDCRERMELEATQNIINFFNNKKIKNLI